MPQGTTPTPAYMPPPGDAHPVTTRSSSIRPIRELRSVPASNQTPLQTMQRLRTYPKWERCYPKWVRTPTHCPQARSATIVYRLQSISLRAELILPLAKT